MYIGEIGTTSEEKNVEWKIKDFALEYANYGMLDSQRFIFGCYRFFIAVHPRNHLGCIEAQLCCDKDLAYPVKYQFGFKKRDGSVLLLHKGVMEEGKRPFMRPWIDLMELSQLLRCKSELVPSDVLTITCTLKLAGNPFIQPSVLNEVKLAGTDKSLQVDLKSPSVDPLYDIDKLLEDLKHLLADVESCDTILKVSDKEYKAHRTILSARSSVFAATFKHDTLEKETGVMTIPDCDPASFQHFLEYLYTGKIKQLSSQTALHLYITSDKYDVQELKIMCTKYLMENLTVEVFCDVVDFADKYDETDLFSAAKDFFAKNAKSVFLMSEWKCLMKNNSHLANELLIEMSNIRL